MARQQINSQQEFESKLSRTAPGAGNLLNVSFRDTDFNIEITIRDSINLINFSNCNFNENFSLNAEIDRTVTFDRCKFEKEFDIQNCKFLKKVRIQRCHFIGETYFNNSSFSDLADFWRTVFYKKTIFYKVDFNQTAVFSAATFEENVLFTYSLIGKLILFRGTAVKKGFDMSLAIISGKVGLFDFHLNDYKSLEASLSEDEYENAVTVTGEIPIRNKRETFRILKDNLESQKNLSESLKFKAIEKEILRKELIAFKNNESSKWWEKIKNWINNRLERVNLFLNKLSNDHGNSYGRAFLFILGIGLFFFYFSLISLDQFSFTLDYEKWAFNESFRYFMEFLNPIHKFDYLGTEIILSKRFYVLDFFGKTFVGYGIYQFIQAFRKYK